MSEQMDFNDGKYTVISDNGRLTALRYGEPWNRDITGDNLIYWMLVEAIRLKEERDASAAKLKEQDARIDDLLACYLPSARPGALDRRFPVTPREAVPSDSAVAAEAQQAEPVLLMEEEIHGADKWLEDAPFWRVVKFARAIEAAVLRKQGYKVEA